ncbi:hypothetical protein HZA43_02115 [Candidatus Peregrinibacteria bacterium]|nr:hypothetical protein [Candidatus Peregrinibacteria bacterium]
MTICVQCSTGFEVTDADRAFYDKVSPVFNGQKYAIPEPTHCPDCRLQRKIAWRNERCLYKQTCGKCKKWIVSVHSNDATYPVYCNHCWWGDGWNAHDYGRDVDFSRPFFDQVRELMDVVPQLAMQNDDGVTSVNCQYCQDFAFGKNCYFVIGTWYTQDSFYSSIDSSYNRDVCDCTHVYKSELAYESIDSEGLYNCIGLQNSEGCRDCAFGFDLKGCRDCFACVGLRQKQYYIFNQPHTAEEYRKKIESFPLGSYHNFKQSCARYLEWVLRFPRKNMNLKNCQDSVGDHLFNCKNTFGFSLLNAEEAKWCYQGDQNRFSYDIFNSGRPNWCYEGLTPDDSYLTHFSWFSWKNKYVLYGINCHTSEHLFGCVSLHRSKYCILNKQYSKEKYEQMVGQIVGHMVERGEWGEFMPIQHSFFHYNDTVAQEYFPVTKEVARSRGWKWKDANSKEYAPQHYVISEAIQDVPDTVMNELLACTQCGKNYKIIAQELAFYRKMNIPIPRECPDCRHRARLKLRTAYKLYSCACAKCSAPIQTTYSPDRPEIVYCEQCYLKEVY